MTNRTYFIINRGHQNRNNVTVVVDGLVPIPPPGTRFILDDIAAEVISSKIEISRKSKLYEQTIFCNGRV